MHPSGSLKLLELANDPKEFQGVGGSRRGRILTTFEIVVHMDEAGEEGSVTGF